ncbi:MAG TPA: hypothetical protein VFF79_07780 [Conexibacter sp.]|jgi:hypothetical protein|nr:hypothetical protein [Conexibacter sp.]
MADRARLGERAAVASSSRRHGQPAASRTRTRARARILALATRHEHWSAAAIFALVVLAFLWPVLVAGHPFLPAADLYRFAPWASSAPAGAAGNYNVALLDVPLSYYPWDLLARHYLHAGIFPAWNPYAFGGTPFLANPEVAWLSPFSVPLWILPLPYALGLVAALKLWVGAFGTYLLVRELRLAFWPAVVAGLSFAFCTFNVVWLSHGVQVTVAVMLPWAIWLVERIVRRGRALDGLALVAVVALVMTGGHPGTQLHVCTAVVLYALMRATFAKDLERSARVRRLGLVGAALLLGTLLAAPTLLPAQQAALDTAGAAARRNGSASTDFLGSHLSFAALRAALFPEWWGRASETFAPGNGSYSERALFAGTIPLMLAAVALVSRGGWRVKGPLAVLGALGLAIGLRAPVIRDAVVNAPLFDVVQDQRILLWFLFAIAVLSAFGLQAVLNGAPGRRRAWGALAAALAAAALAVATIPTIADGALGQALQYFLHRSDQVVEEGVQPLASVGWLLVPAVAFALVLVLATWRPQRRALLGAAVGLLVALELLHAAQGFLSMGPASSMLPPRTAAVAFLQQHRAEGRMAGVNLALASDWSSTYGLRDVRGYDAPQPSLRFDALWRTINPNQSAHSEYVFGALSPESLRVLSLLGARYVLADPGTEAGGLGLQPAYRGSDATIFENPHAAGRALVAGQVHVAGSLQEEIEAATEAAFDPQRDVVVRRDELPAAFDAGQAGRGHAQVVGDQNARVTLRARLDHPGVVLLDDAWAPGWSVRVDGKPAQALQADVVLRGVVVPAGEHEVVWSYRVPGLRLGVALALLALLATLAWAGALIVRRRRS